MSSTKLDVILMFTICIGLLFVALYMLYAIDSDMPVYDPVIVSTQYNTTHVYNTTTIFNTTVVETTVVSENNFLYKERSEQCDGVSIYRLEETTFTGSSMQPEIYSYYTGLMKKPDSRKSFVEGDVVVYENDSGVRIGHRVSGVYDDYLVVCPLNTYSTGVSYCDHVDLQDVIGVVCGVLYG